MKVRIALIALASVLAIALIIAGIRSSQQNTAIAELEKQLHDAQEQIRAIPPSPAPEDQPSPPPEASRSPRTKVELVPDPNAEALRSQLQEATAQLSQLQARMVELESQVQALNTQRDRLTAAESEARTGLEEMNRKLDSVNAERVSMDKRLRDLETENNSLRERNLAAAQKDGRLSKHVADLQDILRRQQTYLNNVVSRYREIAKLVQWSSASDRNQNEPDLGRAEMTLSMADEDLKALRDLNARLTLVQTRISDAIKQP
jgi:SMC interacting uncharacterized protein involved in chromosome segregation